MTNPNTAPERLNFPDNIVADRHEVSGKWVLHYLTDEQATQCAAAMSPAPSSGLREALERVSELEEALADAEPLVWDACSSYHKSGMFKSLDAALDKYHKSLVKVQNQALATPAEVIPQNHIPDSGKMVSAQIRRGAEEMADIILGGIQSWEKHGLPTDSQRSSIIAALDAARLDAGKKIADWIESAPLPMPQSEIFKLRDAVRAIVQEK